MLERFNLYLKGIKFVLILCSLIALIIITVLITGRIITKRNNTIGRLEYNTTVTNNKLSLITNKYGDIVAERNSLELTKKELESSTNNAISILKNKVLQQDVKIKNLEYALTVNYSWRIDTTIVTKYDTIDKIRNIDSLNIGDFKLVRIQEINTLLAHYNITYNPDLYISISHYKEGKWKLKNIFKPREIRYKVLISSSDKLLVPRNITILKLVK